MATVVVLIYPVLGTIIITFGVGNSYQFNSRHFQTERVKRLLPPGDLATVLSLEAATGKLLPTGASMPSWTFDTGDDSWLVSIATLKWNQAESPRKALWVIRYCLDWKWGEHFIEAASLNDEAHQLTPSLTYREAIYGDGHIPVNPKDLCKCVFY